jgi:ectoine hydroxylase-related dioxygenase (phytanoyl-CoA dioxygenase family)
MRRIFTDPKVQKQFDKKGYVTIELFSPEEIAKFIELYEEIEGVKGTANTNKNTYELSFFEKDVAAKKRKFNVVYTFMKPLLDRYLDRYTPIMINLFNKEHGTGEVPIHQNWTFVDEKKYSSVSVWIPLQNVTRKNGTLEVVPGSHKVISAFRGPSIPWVFDNLNDLMKEKYMLPFELKPGEVGIIDDSMIHYSSINQTTGHRKAVQLILKPEEAPTIHCYKEDMESDTIKVMEVDDDYFFDFDMWSKPKPGKNLSQVTFPIHKITESELVELCNRNLTAAE